MMLRTANREVTATLPRSIQWEEVPCLLCGSGDCEPCFEASDATPAFGTVGRKFLVVRCLQCSLIYTNPRPNSDSIHQFYPTDYKPHRRPDKLATVHARSRILQRILGRSPERRGDIPWTGAGRLLDFGCGGGSYLQRMSEKGWEVTGLDVSIGTTHSIREDLGLRAFSGDLPHPDLTPCSFDVATMWHSLEHVPYPMETLREVYQLLTPGGKLIVACPNIQSWSFRQFGTSWYGLDVPRHLTHFTASTLRLALQTSGFRIESLRTISHSGWVRSSARLAKVNGQNSLLNRVLRSKPAAKLASWLAYCMGQSDCLIAIAERPR